MVTVSSLFVFSTIILFLAVAKQGLGIPDDDHVRRCSENEPPIRFPFQFYESQLDYKRYHYPGFNISCAKNGVPILGLPTLKAEFYIQDIDYASQEIHVYDNPDYCLLGLLLSENGSRPMEFPFEFKYDRLKKYTSYTVFNCSSSRYRLYYNSPHIQFCGLKLVPSNFEISENNFEECTKMYDTESIPDNIYNDYVTLTWSKPDCRSCEANRKGCRFKKDSDDEVECFRRKRGKDEYFLLI
ncbi:hypothetical protein TorRG33x02_102020 [Trema orientale]|uniref:RING-type E3 ubiquitin transferase n=1 Tax=Trema orientale TaxID=63057 RepID=A0A2P5F8P1_TREOI|nr:hypothetical protein TorRG33x02_102020 [Trema orientale]